MSETPKPRFVVPFQGGRPGIPGHPSNPAGAGAARAGAPRPEAEQDGQRGRGGEPAFRAVFEHVSGGVVLTQLDGRFVDVNHGVRELLAGTGIDPDTGSLHDLTAGLPEGSDEARAWREGLSGVCSGRIPVARVQVCLAPAQAAPAQAAPRWVRATAALVVFGGRRYLLAHLEDTALRQLGGQRVLEEGLQDDVTGLADRSLLAARLAAGLVRSAAGGLNTGVVCLDLDDFSRINDRLGRAGGDRVLAVVGRRLAGLLRAGDTAGRVEDDDFVVIAGDVPDARALTRIARRIATALAEPLDVDRARFRVQVSVGTALAQPGDTLATVTERARQALNEARRSRRSASRVDLDAVQLALIPDDADVATT